MTPEFSAADEPIDDLIADIIEISGGTPHSDLVKEIILTATRLVTDGTSRGDLKIINSALKELRYSFKVFADWRDQRKVTIFGSARLTPDRPAYRQAVEFSRKVAEAGYTSLWLPPPFKGASGTFSVGFDSFDRFAAGRERLTGGRDAHRERQLLERGRKFWRDRQQPVSRSSGSTGRMRGSMSCAPGRS